MELHYENLDLQADLDDLQSQALKLIGILVGGVGYLGLVLLLWPATGSSASGSMWLAAIVLSGCAIASQCVRKRFLPLASHVLVWGTACSVGLAILGSRAPGSAYLLVVPIIFASVLLGQVGLAVATGGSYAFVAALSVGASGVGWGLAGPLPLLVTLGLVAAAAWLSARSLYTAVGWMWSGYEEARRNAEVARLRQGELARTLKALDEATYRLQRANYSLGLARDRAEEARRLKQQFAQTISHELRTPLNLIVGFTELMVQSPEYYGGQLSAAHVRDLSIVHRNARHLQTLVSDVLDLARIDAAQMSLVPEHTDLGELVGQATKTVTGLFEARGLWLRTDVEPDLPRLWIDPVRIRQVLLNLLNNAARFTAHGGVTVGVRRRADEVLFDVIDTGVGIPAEDLPRVFEEFQQLHDDGGVHADRGVGLGLAISQRFVELHGGRIWVESDLGAGSVFHFSLPVGDPTSLEVHQASSDGQSAAAVGSAGEPTMLAVTPSPTAAALLTRYVRGCHKVVVPDLGEAERAARRLAPQAVVVDEACEGSDAANLLSLAEAWELPNTPFLSCPLPGEGTMRRRLNVDGYLIKPVSRESLWDVLRQFGENVDTILVVDDDRDFVRLMGRMLDSPLRRYQIIGAHSGHRSLELIDLHQPDLLFLDLILPDIDGVEVVRRARLSRAGRQLPIVIVSAQDEVERLETVAGTLSVSKGEGMTPGEIVRWVQAALETAMQGGPSRA